MELIDANALAQMTYTEPIYAFSIRNGKPYFIGWGEKHEGGLYRAPKSAVKIPMATLMDEELAPNQAIYDVKGHNYTPEVLIKDWAAFEEYIGEITLMFKCSVEEFQKVFPCLQDGEYVFCFMA